MGLSGSRSCADPGSRTPFNCMPCSVPGWAQALPAFSSCQQPPTRGAHFHCRGWRGWRPRSGRDLLLPRVSTHKGTTSRAGAGAGIWFMRKGVGNSVWHTAPCVSLSKTEKETPKGGQSARESTQVGGASGSGLTMPPPPCGCRT